MRDASRKIEAAKALKITAPDLVAVNVVDEIVPEPLGGAHTDHEAAARLPQAKASESTRRRGPLHC